MKKILFLIVYFCSSCNMMGQILEREKPSLVTMQHRICFYGRYELNKDGLYYYKECDDNVVSPNDYCKLSEGKERFFGYDNKYNRFYFYTNNMIGYYCPTQQVNTKEFKKRLIDNKVPLFSIEDVPKIKNIARNILDKLYKEKNDSIINKRRVVKEEQLEKKIRDSIEVVNKYKKNHTWHDLTLDIPISLYCDFCKDDHIERELYIISLSADTIYYLKSMPTIFIFGKSYSDLHYGRITEQLKQNKSFNNYVKIWRDSLVLHNDLTNNDAAKVNFNRFHQYKAEIIKEVPYGFVESWGWNLNSADGVEPYFTYYNTSEKTIKYIDFYFNLYNAVGDKCFLKYNNSYTGFVRGVGPVKSYSSGSWTWERATHYTTADASEMRIVKIVITYMDKTVRTLTGNAIKYN